jgi:hypothetical protein
MASLILEPGEVVLVPRLQAQGGDTLSGYMYECTPKVLALYKPAPIISATVKLPLTGPLRASCVASISQLPLQMPFHQVTSLDRTSTTLSPPTHRTSRRMRSSIRSLTPTLNPFAGSGTIVYYVLVPLLLLGAYSAVACCCMTVYEPINHDVALYKERA